MLTTSILGISLFSSLVMGLLIRYFVTRNWDQYRSSGPSNKEFLKELSTKVLRLLLILPISLFVGQLAVPVCIILHNYPYCAKNHDLNTELGSCYYHLLALL